MTVPASRRSFLALASGAAACRLLSAQQPSLARRNVLELDRTLILAQAKAALALEATTPRSPSFHSEVEPNPTTAGALGAPKLDRADAEALQQLSVTVADLTAGYVATNEEAYGEHAIAHLRRWFFETSTRLQPSFDGSGCAVGSTKSTPMGVVDLVPLAEIARALSFLTDRLSPDEAEALDAWCQAAVQWLQTNKQALIARDAKDRRASAWLLTTAALGRFLRDENVQESCRKIFRTQTLRHQVRPDGVFPQEVATPNSYRNTLFNFDLLAGACQLLSSQFDLLWEHELIDGVGLRIVAAYLYPVVAHPERWGYPADAEFFRALPGRRPGMLFAGRAYNRPEYVEAWQQGTPAEAPESIRYSFPIRQPALWTARAPHGR